MADLSAKLVRIDAQGAVQTIRSHNGWSKKWTVVVGLELGKSWTSLLFYDRRSGAAKLHHVGSDGSLKLVREYVPFDADVFSVGRWTHLVPVDLSGATDRAEVLAYDRESGMAAIFQLTQAGELERCARFKWKPVWDEIVAGRFGGGGMTDVLVYSRYTGEAKVVRLSPTDAEVVRAHRWRHSWTQIVPGRFATASGAYDDLLLYRRMVGDAKVLRPVGDGTFDTVAHHTNWHKRWDVIVPLRLGSDQHTDLLLYERATGKVGVRKGDGAGSFGVFGAGDTWRRDWIDVLPGRFGKDVQLLLRRSPLRIRVHAVRCADDNGGRAAAVTPANVVDWVAKANEVYARAGVQFEFDPGQDFVERRDTTLNRLMRKSDADDVLKQQWYAAAKEAATKYAKARPDRLVVFFRYGHLPTKPVGNGFSSHEAPYVGMPGWTDDGAVVFRLADGDTYAPKASSNLKLFSHEVGHYLGIPHPFTGPELGKAKDAAGADALLAARYLAAGSTIRAFDADGDNDVHDTPPDIDTDWWRLHGRNPADPDAIVEFSVNGSKARFSPDRHNVMSYKNCDDGYTITRDQARRVREHLMYALHRVQLVMGQL